MLRSAACFLVLLLVSVTSLAKPALRPFIVDNDMGVDDAMALVYLLKRSNISIEAITIAADGNAHCQPAFENTLGLLQFMHKESIPVACGADKPLAGTHTFPAFVMAIEDQLGETKRLLPAIKQKAPRNAVDLLVKTIAASKEPVTIVALGPLTNIAQAFSAAPAIKQNIKTIYIMGGAVHVPGNLRDANASIANNAAEWNIYIDPLAANQVFSSGVPIVLVGLDVTNQLPINMQFYKQLKRKQHSPEAAYVFAILKNNLNMLRQNVWYFWDPLTAVIADDASIAQIKQQPVRVVLTPEQQSGATIIDNKNGTPVGVVVAADGNKFKNRFLSEIASV